MRTARRFKPNGIPVLNLEDDPPVSGSYITINEHGTDCRMYLPSQDEIARLCEVFRYEDMHHMIMEKRCPYGGTLANGGVREYWTSRIYGRRVSTREPVDLCDNEYWNQF